MSRIDQALVDQGFFKSREKAKRSVMAGQVLINGHKAQKPSDKVRPDDQVALLETERFVSRGGYKLERGLDYFNLEAKNRTAIDVGASTGGFTDCLLQRGASLVYAVDVGHGQLDWQLRNNPKVVVKERLNARHLTQGQLGASFEPVDLITVDCSFISLKKILLPLPSLLKASGNIVALIKPQFEAGKKEADRGAGVIKDPEIHRRILWELELFVGKMEKLSWHGCTESPITGPAGNREFLAWIKKMP